MPSYDWEDWTDWRQLDGIDSPSVPSEPGAYVIATDRQLRRAVGVDRNGLLDIGESVGLRGRLRAFVRCATGVSEEGHAAGCRYARFALDRHFPFHTLRVRWIKLSTKDQARGTEGRLMREYVHRHSELPPLNYTFSWAV